MPRQIELCLNPEAGFRPDGYTKEAARALNVAAGQIKQINLLKRSVDARQRDIKVRLRMEAYLQEETPPAAFRYEGQYVEKKRPVAIIGSGPAGLFAALRLIELGLKPVIFERGAQAAERKRDIARLNSRHQLKPDSNYCFGEGGAGTFSDGKLYTRSTKRGNVRYILDQFHLHGATEEIRYDSHPHIGTDKLPRIVENIRKTIEEHGGEYHFNSKLTDIELSGGKLKGISINGGKLDFDRLILATGHSARHVYELLHSKGILLEAKPFALGLRAEHPQELIDRAQYKNSPHAAILPAAEYQLRAQVDGRGVYSFCMCPGGYLVPSATEEGQMVLNGMSPAARNSPFANAGIVVETSEADWQEFADKGPLAGMYFQASVEKLAALNSGSGQMAPAQRISDFVKRQLSPGLPPTSYIPGLVSSPLHFWLPPFISESIQTALKAFRRTIRGYVSDDALFAGVETRTSSPVRIPRQKGLTEVPGCDGLYACGEGAGYAGGIVSSAMDGMRAAEQLAAKVLK